MHRSVVNCKTLGWRAVRTVQSSPLYQQLTINSAKFPVNMR